MFWRRISGRSASTSIRSAGSCSIRATADATRGTAGQRLQEKTITLNLTNRVARILRSYGYKVDLTRTRDATLSLDARSAYANRAKADLFVSIHVNSAADRSVRGIETFCLTPEGAASSNSGKPDPRKYAGNAKNPQNFLLAYNIQRSMLAQTRTTDRGVKFARFAVLRDVRARPLWLRSASCRTATTRRISAAPPIRTSSRAALRPES